VRFIACLQCKKLVCTLKNIVRYQFNAFQGDIAMNMVQAFAQQDLVALRPELVNPTRFVVLSRANLFSISTIFSIDLNSSAIFSASFSSLTWRWRA
jgi:hypothetical protein